MFKNTSSFVPARLIDEAGVVHLGEFVRSVREVNGSSFDYRSPMGARQSAWARRFHYKQFQYFGVMSESLLCGCALAHTGYLGLAFVYVYCTKTRRMVSETFRLPLAYGLLMSTSPVVGESVWTSPGADIRMIYQEDTKAGLTKSLSVRTTKGLHITANMQESHAFQARALCTQTGVNGWTYANKVAGIPVAGTVQSQLGTFDFSNLDAMGHHDFSAGYMRRETFWNWACFSARVGGHELGLNVSCGVNETSYSENCLWIDGTLIPVGLAQFTYDRSNPNGIWRVQTSDGAVQLVFTPAGVHSERMNLAVFASRFLQYFGQFSGIVRCKGENIPIHQVWGFVEDQYAKW
jgi:hypothetical protein